MPNRRSLVFLLLFALAITTIITLSPSVASAGGWIPEHSSVVTEALKGTHPGSDWIRTLYKTCLGFVNIIAFLLLLVAAFANILHINIETYSVKKILPQLIIALILANVALPLIAIFSSVIDSLHELSLFKPQNWNFTYVATGFGKSFHNLWPAATSEFGGGGWMSLSIVKTLLATLSTIVPLIVLGIIMTLISVFVMFLISLILAFRPYIIFIAAAISPIAIILSVLPQTQQWFKRWLGIIIPWMIMPLVVYFLFNIGNKINASVDNFIIPGSGFVGTLIGIWMPLLIKVGLVFLAIRFPFMIEKDISSVIGKLGNYAGKAGWAGVGLATKYSGQKQDAYQIKKASQGEIIATKAMKGGRNEQTIVEKSREEKIKEIRKLVTEKFNKGEQLTQEELGYYHMTDNDITASAKSYAEGSDIRLSDEEEKVKRREIEADLDKKIEVASKIAPPNRTAEESRLADLEANLVKKRAEIDKRFDEFEKMELEERRAERANDFGRDFVQDWKKTDKGSKRREFIRQWNPYGIVQSYQARKEAEEKATQKEYSKYSRINAVASGHLINTKYHQGVVKEDLGELPTAEQMVDYCRGSMGKFYANVRKQLEAEGLTGLTDEEVIRTGNRLLKRFRTDVKGTKDYLAHPYFNGLTDREIATVIEGDYNISRQMAIEMRRTSRTIQDRELEARKAAVYASGGSGTDKSQVSQQSERDSELARRQTEKLLGDIERAIIKNPSLDPATLAQALATQTGQIASLNSNDFRRENVEVVLPQIAQRAQDLKMNIDINATLNQGGYSGVGQIESNMNTSGIDDEEMKTLLRQYTKNAIAEMAISGSSGSGMRTNDVARRIASSEILPQNLEEATKRSLGEYS